MENGGRLHPAACGKSGDDIVKSLKEVTYQFCLL